MARSFFGGTSNDLVYGLTSERLLKAATAGLTVTFWSAATGGTRYTDLLLAGVAVDHVNVNTSGILPQFQGPDAITAMWADAGGGRVLLTIPGTGGGVTSYTALTDKPTIPDSPDDIGAATAAQGAKADTAVQPAALTAAQAFAVQRANHTGSQTSSSISDLQEAVEDAVGAILGRSTQTGITWSYNDASGTLSATVTGAGSLDAEGARDAIGVALVGVGNVSVVANDGADTITISTTATVNSTDAQLRDRSTHTGLTPLSGVAAGTRLDCPLDGTVSTNANLARPSARTDIFFTWNTTVQPVNAITGDKWEAPA